MVVDNAAKKIHGHLYVDGPADAIDRRIADAVADVTRTIQNVYLQEKSAHPFPSLLPSLEKISFALKSLRMENR